MKSVLPLLTVLVSATLIGCSNPPDRQPEDVPSSAGFVTVVGDDTASLVVDQLGKHSVRTSTSLDDQAESSLLIVVQDCTVGPLPVHWEIAQKLSIRPDGDYLWIFTNTSLVDDQELLELEELECREIFSSQGLPGDSVMFGFDSPSALVRPDYACPKGWSVIIRHVQTAVD